MAVGFPRGRSGFEREPVGRLDYMERCPERFARDRATWRSAEICQGILPPADQRADHWPNAELCCIAASRAKRERWVATARLPSDELCNPSLVNVERSGMATNEHDATPEPLRQIFHSTKTRGKPNGIGTGYARSVILYLWQKGADRFTQAIHMERRELCSCERKPATNRSNSGIGRTVIAA